MHAGWRVAGHWGIALDDVAKAYEDVLAGCAPPAWLQHTPARFWHLSSQLGVNPHGASSVVLSAAEQDRRWRKFRLTPAALNVLWAGLEGVAGGDRTVEVTDGDGYVLLRKGDRSSTVFRRVNEVGFRMGACMAMCAMGENGIAHALECREPIQVPGPYHWRRNQQSMNCTAVPVLDPRRKGRTLAVINITALGPIAHPDTLRLARVVADNISRELAGAHRTNVRQLCAHAGSLDRITGWALVTDRDGWVAISHRLPEPPERVAFPEGHQVQPGRCQLSELDRCVLEPLPGGWLVRPELRGEDDPVIQVVLESRERGHWWLRVTGLNVAWEHQLPPRHAEILRSLAIAHRHGGGRTGPELSRELYGREAQVSHEVCRIREYAAGLLDPGRRAPYRFADAVRVATP